MTATKEKTKKTDSTYHGKTVTVVRDAVSGDPGFKGDGKNDQSIITLDDGTEHTVLNSEIETEN